MMNFLSMFFTGSPSVQVQQASRILDLLAEKERLGLEVDALKETITLRDEEISGLRRELHHITDAIIEIDDAWAACPYPGNRKHLSLAEQMAALDTELNAYRDEVRTLAAAVANAERDGPKRTLEKANDAQAARAMARNTKQAFQVYQGAVRIILDRLDGLARGNHVTKEDIRKLRQLRVDLGEQIGRSI